MTKTYSSIVPPSLAKIVPDPNGGYNLFVVIGTRIHKSHHVNEKAARSALSRWGSYSLIK